jgi:hypothetical protein
MSRKGVFWVWAKLMPTDDWFPGGCSSEWGKSKPGGTVTWPILRLQYAANFKGNQ